VRRGTESLRRGWGELGAGSRPVVAIDGVEPMASLEQREVLLPTPAEKRARSEGEDSWSGLSDVWRMEHFNPEALRQGPVVLVSESPHCEGMTFPHCPWWVPRWLKRLLGVSGLRKLRRVLNRRA